MTAGNVAATVVSFYILRYLHVFQRCGGVGAGASGDDGLTMREFQKADRVAHARFGPGVIVAVDAHYTTIEFDESGVRKFITALVRLEHSNLPVPVKPAPRRRRSAQARSSGAPKA